jgi:stearoyl-CoA desaturase (delta-9 desaturase)
LGLASALHTSSEADVTKALLLTAEEKIKIAKKGFEWGPELSSLPKMTRMQVEGQSADGKILIIVDGVVYDLSNYSNIHPGGAKILKAYAGRDSSIAFNGGLNTHTQAARTLARKMAVARLAD